MIFIKISVETDYFVIVESVQKEKNRKNTKSILLETHANISYYILQVEVKSLENYNIEDLRWERAVIFVVSTYEGGKLPTTAQQFGEGLQDMACDFRVSKTYYKDTGYTIFGIGHRDYGRQFNKAAKVSFFSL